MNYIPGYWSFVWNKLDDRMFILGWTVFNASEKPPKASNKYINHWRNAGISVQIYDIKKRRKVPTKAYITSVLKVVNLWVTISICKKKRFCIVAFSDMTL